MQSVNRAGPAAPARPLLLGARCPYRMEVDPLLAARAQMEVSLGFHMIFAALGIGMPLLMVLAELLWRRTGREHYRELARTWGKATALLFAVGAVSGTALSFELGLLWPRFMEIAGARV